MNIGFLQQIIETYKSDFERIHDDEIYKWQAFKCFQDYWDINASDFVEMITKSLSLTKNLLGSGTYYPRRMIKEYSRAEPEVVRNMFVSLYDEEVDLIKRINDFQKSAKDLNVKLSPEKNDYQDSRAVLVYLCLRYPERYFLYKFTMFRDFAKVIGYQYIPKSGRKENIIQYITLCNLLKAEIEKDGELVQMHSKRLSENHFQDTTLNILTQDVIYATVNTLNIQQYTNNIHPQITVEEASYVPEEQTTQLHGVFVNFIDLEKEKKRIGDLGELFILEYEMRLLLGHNIKSKPVHISKEDGDGLGFDILSKNIDKSDKYIEVKTTKGNINTPFYITRNELVKSQQNPGQYFLYRVYDFDAAKNTGNVYIIKGDLTNYCDFATTYRVVLKKE